MGQYFIVVNVDKQQFFNPAVLGEANKLGGVIRNKRTTWATSLLVTWTAEVNRPSDLLGFWHGDKLYLAGDSEPADTAALQTSTPTEPERNLYQLAFATYTDISYELIALLSTLDPETAVALAKLASNHERTLIDMGNVVYCLGCRPLEEQLTAALGKQWSKRYERALANHSDWWRTRPKQYVAQLK